ncbi:MAG: transposase [Solirubrobacterales bacterium]|nr:transposase [Solirubrobacterales bacterium]
MSRSRSAKRSFGSSCARSCSATTTSPFATQSRSLQTDSQAVRYCIRNVKALRKAIRQVFGHEIPVQRWVQHKERNVLDHLPERDRDMVKRRLRQAWQDDDHDIALEQLNALALELDKPHPGAANSLREGMEETLTVTRLGITGKLKRTLQSTNPCESMISTVRAINRNVKNWSSGEMCLRWTAAGMLEAETRFRKVEGYRGLANLAMAIEHDLTRRRQKQLTPTLNV